MPSGDVFTCKTSVCDNIAERQAKNFKKFILRTQHKRRNKK